MSMQITSFKNPSLQYSQPPSKSMVDRIVDSTALSANYLASGVSGGVTGTVAYGRSVLGTAVRSTVSGVTNLWKAETIGPNLKIIGTAAALPLAAAAAAIALPVSLVAGICYGVGKVDASKPREFTVGAAGAAGYSRTREGWKNAEKGMLEGFNDLGTEKLRPGQKPYDIPIIKLAKTLVIGAASVAVGGAVGAACAVVSGLREMAVGVAHAVTDKSLNLPGKALAAVGATVGGAVQGLYYGVGGALSVAGHGLVDTWKNDSLGKGAGSAIHHAVDLVGGAINPEGALTRDVPPQP